MPAFFDGNFDGGSTLRTVCEIVTLSREGVCVHTNKFAGKSSLPRAFIVDRKRR
jgi:hypothetical protein